MECYRRVWNFYFSNEKHKVKGTSGVKAYPYLDTDADWQKLGDQNGVVSRVVLAVNYGYINV